MILTIAIPTFDRPEELERCVSVLAPQLTENVELLIIDNASPVAAAEVLSHVLRSYPSAPIRIERNAHNIGGNANILRCIEHSSSDWIWLVGDDDLPGPESVRKALDQITLHPEAICINFKSVFGSKRPAFETTGRLEFLQKCPGVGNLIFISANLYRVSSMRSNLYVGHRYAYSMAPHFAMLLVSMNDRDRVVYVGDEIAKAKVSEASKHWSAVSQALSWPTLLELPLSPPERKYLAARLQLPSVVNVLIQLLGSGRKQADFRSSSFYFGQYVGRVKAFSSPTKRFQMWLGRPAFFFPTLAIAILDAALKRYRGSSVAKRLRRDLNDPHC